MTEQKTNKILNKNLQRGNGIIMPIFSLPSNYGIGTFGKAAYEFVDFCANSSIKYWQILPLGPTSYGDSPYQSFSSFAGNPYFIDLDLLKEDSLLKEEDYINVDFGDNPRYVDYSIQYNMRYRILKKAYENGKEKLKEDIKIFREKEKFRLDDYALYMAIKTEKLDVSRLEFPKEYKERESLSLEKFSKEHEEEINFYIFVQYEFFKQWNNLKTYANRKKIKIIGDIPIYVAMDSADAWANSNILKLDENKNPIFLSGAPPDGFNENGQLRGNPLYDWDKMEENNFKFWIDRLMINNKLFDIIRLDHFIGFNRYYEIPSTDDNAKYGKWVDAKPEKFFKTVLEKIPDIQFIVEDLGVITDEIRKMKNNFNFPGMKVIQFAFDSSMKSENLPHNYEKNSVCYSSTHDQSTINGWLNSLDEENLQRVKNYFALTDEEGYNWGIIRGLMSSVSTISIFEIQDFLNLSDDARINFPGKSGGNRKRRTLKEDFSNELSEKIKKMGNLYDRN
ncbi:MAG: 4-alpha-glucanotransferase [Peptoniphilaceae bacterium]|nr:4-alpha-glucanotransferase [Peptoniphilaceae bacterium]MDD7383871.1 4-alpha-glucanotransferase [Peptoniphilaceae bacterium]MDY3738012.1 4-alpha-glucanotransferase [Peptoniphilaceae bacterium]